MISSPVDFAPARAPATTRRSWKSTMSAGACLTPEVASVLLESAPQHPAKGRSAMRPHLFAILFVAGILSVASAGDAGKEHGSPPRILIASGIDADGNLIVSGTEQRQKKV